MSRCLSIALIGVLASRACAAAVPRPNLVPLPHKVRPLGRAVPLPPAARIVCDRAADPLLRAGIGEIQRVLKALGAPPLAVVAERGDAGPFEILLSTRSGSALHPQAYTIRFDREGERETALLTGDDPQGVLYACVTFAQMLRRDGERVVVDAADVDDAPDFTTRMAGRLPAAPPRLRAARTPAEAGRELADYGETTRRYLDFCLRFKINALTLRSGGTATWSNVQAFGPVFRQALREAADYARERGIVLEASAYSAVDVGQGGPAAEVQCVRTHGVGYCWSRDDLLRQQAREFARFAREAGIGIYYLHAPDRTSAENPSNFGERCVACKARWRDDERAKADAHVMNLMYEEIRKESPQTRICAVLVPYGASLDRLPKEQGEQILRYWREASALLPEDMLICVRENRRANVAEFKRAFARQPVYFYIESIIWRGWEPFFSTSPRVIRTFDFDDPRDLYYLGNSGDYKALAEAMAAHFAWNTGAPGAGEQRAYNNDPLHDGQQPPEVARDLVDAICSRFFGEAAGPLVGGAVRGDVSWSFTDRPEEMSSGAIERLAGRESDIPGWEATTLRGLDDLPALMRHQQDGSERGLRALRDAFERLPAGGVPPDAWQRDQMDFLQSYYASVYALASVRAPALAAAAALKRGEYARAEALAAEGLQAMAPARRQLEEMAAGVGETQRWYGPARRVAEKVDGEKPRLDLLLRLAQGVVVEDVDSLENLAKAAFLLRGRQAQTAGSGNGRAELEQEGGRVPGQPLLRFTRPERPWDGCRVSFGPVDIRPYLAEGGFLRFYVNSPGPKGWHRATFIPSIRRDGDAAAGRWVYLHFPSSEERQRNARPGFVDVDDLPETWQLVSIPLRDLAEEGAAWLSGFQLNFAAIPAHDLLIADPYVIGNTQPVPTERRIR